jgi:DNA-binding FadR family transcriptional regulator
MTVFEPVDASSTYEETVRRLGIAIRIGVLPPESRLPPERELAEQLRISRSTLRQALATLTATGHLTAMRGRLGGTFVSPNPPLTSGERMPRKRRRELLDWRVALELGIAQLAAERASAEDRGRLEEAHRRLEEASAEDFAACRRADVAFHLALAESTGSTRLVAAMTELQGDLCDLMVETEMAERPREQLLREHREVLDAVADGDAPRAVARMREHLEATEQQLPNAA